MKSPWWITPLGNWDNGRAKDLTSTVVVVKCKNLVTGGLSVALLGLEFLRLTSTVVPLGNWDKGVGSGQGFDKHYRSNVRF